MTKLSTRTASHSAACSEMTAHLFMTMEPGLSERTDFETIPQSHYPLHSETKKKKRNKNDSPTVKPLTMASNFWLLPTILQKYRLQEECQIAFEERFYERPKGRTTIKDSMKQNLEEV